ncbi:MAG: permease [Eubacteriales bacterium]|nr:permease [Eubacteriales bacterium]MDD4327791.1 permease [Eubacteriales bacterium]MDD4717934.1 permease [Eubacteriales bacterium]
MFEWIVKATLLALKDALLSFAWLIPYVILGALIGEMLKYTSWTSLIMRKISGAPVVSIVSAVMLGIISPLCTFGTIPVVISLYKAKAPVGPLMAFLAASSLMNPQLFIMIAGGIGLRFALMSLLIAFTFPLLIGTVMLWIPDRSAIRVKHLVSDGTEAEQIPAKKKDWVASEYFRKTAKQVVFVGKYVLIGAVLGSIIESFIPGHYMLMVFEQNEVATILVAALAGIPLYACGGGAIPVIRLMMAQGMTEGTALAFMTVGQGTRLSPLMALASFMKPLFLVGYTIALIVFTTIFGLVLM